MTLRKLMALSLLLLPTGLMSSTQAQNPIQADIASISCVHRIQMAAQADGLIKELRVEEGSIVKKGDVILVIDSQIAEAQLEVARKQLEAAQILAQQVANIEFSKAAMELAIEEYEAEKSLLEKRSTNVSSVRRKRLEAQKADFQKDMAEDEQKKYQLEAAVAQEQVNARQVEVDLYQVIAPYDGIVVERKRDLGEWIRAGEPVVELVHMNVMKVEAFVPLYGKRTAESLDSPTLVRAGISPTELANARMDIAVRLGRDNVVRIPATVEFVSPIIESGRARVVTKVENQPDGRGGWILRDGMVPESVVITPAAE